jgi:hypothetical protein
MANSSPRDTRKADYAEKSRKALEMRKAGANYAQIGLAIGVHESGAWKIVKKAIAAITKEPAKEVLALELTRLDVLLLGVWTKAKNGDAQMVDRALRIMERRAAYLGIDAPKKTTTEFDGAITVTDGAREELLARITTLTNAAAKAANSPKP